MPNDFPSEVNSLDTLLLNTSGNVPLHNRFEALFALKALENDQAVHIISKGLRLPSGSTLLRHELAYILGQMKNTAALQTLEDMLTNEQEDPIVRHEAAEAMGAISLASSIPVLKKYLNDSDRSIRETCEIALAKIEWDNSEEGQRHHSNTSTETQTFTSVDPAPPASGLLLGRAESGASTQPTVEDLQEKLLDRDLPLFERYRAMFALRNIGNPQALNALGAGFSDDSALFKHEIAFVLGQILSPHSVPVLLQVLQDPQESDIVRHEAAEALGDMVTPEILPYLKEYMTREDAPDVVKESCELALGNYEHENSDQSQYLNGSAALEAVKV